jgi:hypothetical protein
MDNRGQIMGVAIVLFLIGMYLSKETTYAKYSGTNLVGFEDKQRFKNPKVRTFGCILILAGILAFIIAANFAR